jgi:low temperature requirement protein LtrA
MWWIYFDLPAEQVLGSARSAFTSGRWGAFIWGYGHLVVFASAAAVGAGLAAAVDEAVGHSELSSTGTALSVTVPVSVYLLSVWLLHIRYKAPGFARTAAVPIAVVAILGSSVFGESVLITGFVMLALIVVSTLSGTHVEKAEVAPLSVGDWRSG